MSVRAGVAGVPVAMEARVTRGGASLGAGSVARAEFEVAGPGLAEPVKLLAVEDGPGLFRASCTLFEAGRFQVTFSALVDGAQVRGAQTVMVDAPGGRDRGSPPPDAAAREGAKWL